MKHGLIVCIIPPQIDNSFRMGMCPRLRENSLLSTPNSERGDAVLEREGRFWCNSWAMRKRFRVMILRSSSLNSEIFFS